MRQLIGTMLIGTVLAYVIVRDNVKAVAAGLMNEKLDADRERKLASRRHSGK